MNGVARLGLFAIIAAVGMASPAFAQTRHQHEVRQSQGATGDHQSGLNAFAAVPSNVDSPALTGGGSTGYNESLRTNQW